MEFLCGCILNKLEFEVRMVIMDASGIPRLKFVNIRIGGKLLQNRRH